MGFSAALIDTLVDRGDIVVHERAPTVQFVADALGVAKPHANLVHIVEAALLKCDAVDEVFIDGDALKTVIDGLKTDRAPSV